MNMKSLCACCLLALAFPAARAAAQTMSQLPVIVVQPFEEIRTNPSAANYAGAITSMMRTAIGSSLIFQTEGGKKLTSYDYQSLRSLMPSAKAGQVFLMTGTVLYADNAIQVDIRVFDAVQESLVYSSFVPILMINSARSAIESYLDEFKNMVFGNVLGKVELSVNAEGADVYLDNRFVGKVPPALKQDFPALYPGEYSLRILASGFMDYQEKIRVRDRRITTVNVQLAQEPGSLILDSNPSGADVLIDGKPSGSTPLRLAQVQPGSYRVTIKKSLFLDYSETINVRSREERTVNASLTVMPGTVRITSEPSGASLFEGETPLGATPVTLSDLAPRKYVFQLRLRDYVTYPLDITIEAANTLTVPVTLTKSQAPVDIYSTPSGAEVWADAGQGKTMLGLTPIQKRPIDYGSYRLSVKKDGYFTKELRLLVDEGRTYNVEAALAMKPASIRVETDPANARIFVDGSYRGNAPLALKGLDPGTHTVEAFTSFGSQSADVELGPDEEKAMSFSIRKPALSFISALVVSGLSLLLFFGAFRN
jgi:TolB-like protein